MASIKLFRRDDPPHELVLEAVPEGSGEHAPDGTREVQFGTQELLELAARLADDGFKPTHVSLRDAYFHALDDDDATALESRLLPELRSGSSAAAINLFNYAGRGCYLWSIELRRTAGGGRVTLDRNGVVREHSPHSSSDFIESLAHAWRGMGWI